MKVTMGIAIYEKSDYPEILNISDDRDSMDATWEEWKKSKENAIKQFQIMGIQTVDVLIKSKELVHYCRRHGLPNTGETRSRFVTDTLNQVDNN